jgi:putative addiction module component (TIGR02574 family)
MSINELLEQVLDLKASERFYIVDELIKSLDKPDREIEKAWIDESQRRLELFNKGELETISEEEFFSYAD